MNIKTNISYFWNLYLLILISYDKINVKSLYCCHSYFPSIDLNCLTINSCRKTDRRNLIL